MGIIMENKQQYENPIISGYNPDPSITRVGDDFYLCTSTFEFFPGVPLYHSRNLADWEQIGYCLTRESQLPLHESPASLGIFAPTLRYHDGVYYMITTNMTQLVRGQKGNFIVHTRDIRGEWSEPAWIDHGGIDPSLYFDEDGQAYYCGTGFDSNGQAIVLFKVDPKTGEILSDKKSISYGCGGKCPEAPHIYKVGGYYYLLLAEGGTEYGHMITIQRAEQIEGPYEPCPNNPILTHRHLNGHRIQATGHGDLVEDGNGRWWMVFLGIRPIGAMLHHLGRETFLAPVEWKDGWPVVAGPATLQGEAVLPGPRTPMEKVFYADFDSAKLPLAFNWVRNPQMDRYILKPEQSLIRLEGEERGLSGVHHSPTFMGIRQKDFDTTARVRMKLNLTEGTIAGLSAYYMHSHHYEIRVNCQDDLHYIELNKAVYDMEMVTVRIPVEGEWVELQMRSDKDKYYFAYRIDGGELHEIGTAMTAGLATEAMETNTFTGTYIGIFAQDGGADFDSFHCEWKSQGGPDMKSFYPTEEA